MPEMMAVRDQSDRLLAYVPCSEFLYVADVISYIYPLFGLPMGDMSKREIKRFSSQLVTTKQYAANTDWYGKQVWHCAVYEEVCVVLPDDMIKLPSSNPRDLKREFFEQWREDLIKSLWPNLEKRGPIDR